MKTAMQELLLELEVVSKIGENPFIKTTVNLIIDMVEEKLDKEKQQIIEAFDRSKDSYNYSDYSGSEYYQQTYNNE